MTWKTIADNKVRHIWADPENQSEEITVSPDWYQQNGTPITPETGEDMIYIRTEIEE